MTPSRKFLINQAMPMNIVPQSFVVDRRFWQYGEWSSVPSGIQTGKGCWSTWFGVSLFPERAFKDIFWRHWWDWEVRSYEKSINFNFAYMSVKERHETWETPNSILFFRQIIDRWSNLPKYERFLSVTQNVNRAEN